MTLKLYLQDARLAELTAQVLDVRSRGDHFDVLLDRTVFFPTSGGQPNDLGWIEGESVLDVRLEGELVWHLLAKAPEPKGVHCRIDWPRRLDHMEQHSGQHLLSSVFLKLYGLRTVSFHLGPSSCTIDLEGGSSLGEEALLQAERRANTLIQEAHPIGIARPSAEELQSVPADLQNFSGEELRIIDMSGVDRSFCCGTHLDSTARLGLFKLLGMERKKGMARVEFLCGGRALSYCERLHQTAGRLIRKSTVRLEELPAYLEGLLEDREAKAQALRMAQAQVARLRAELLASQAQPIGPFKLVRLLEEEGSADELRLLAVALAESWSCVVAGGFRARNTPAGDKGIVLLACPTASGLHAGKLLGEALAQFGGRGGGRPEFAQGGIPNELLARALDWIDQKAAEQLRTRLAP